MQPFCSPALGISVVSSTALRPTGFLMLSSTLLTLSAFSPQVQALDLSWLPADVDGPLPMSKDYRDKLGDLCNSVKDGRVMSPDVPDKKKQLVKRLCAQLRESEQQEKYGRNKKRKGGEDDDAPKYLMIVFMICMGILMYKRITPSPIQSFRSKKRYKAANKKAEKEAIEKAGGMTPEELLKAREARLQRFGKQIDDPAAVQDEIAIKGADGKKDD